VFVATVGFRGLSQVTELFVEIIVHHEGDSLSR
jgi:hypothetical protein